MRNRRLLATWVTMRRSPIRTAQRLRAERRRLRGARAAGGSSVRGPSLVVSLTSFPERIDSVWMVVESLLDQTLPPDRIVLALSIDEFSARRIPRSLERYLPRGLEVLWVAGNPRSYMKLGPARLAYPDVDVVTVDDDAEYDADLLEHLVEAARRAPGHVVGSKGWAVTVAEDGVVPYVSWPVADTATPSERVFLTGVGGVLYPPGLASEADLVDMTTARRICPTADDVWFWAANRAAGVPAICLGAVPYAPLERPRFTSALGEVNATANDPQIAAAVAHFAGRGARILP